jgi:hypothetical protein
MDIPSELKEVLAVDRDVRLVDDGIYSVLPDVASKHHYDKRLMSGHIHKRASKVSFLS